MPTWMILDGEFSEGTFDGGRVCITINAQNIVIVSSRGYLCEFLEYDNGEDKIK